MIGFPERLKELRLENGYTQKELAKLIGFSYQNLQKYEKGIAKPLNKNLVKLSEIFNVSVSYLLGETDIRLNSNIYEIYEQLNESRKEKVYNFTTSQLKEQKEENKIIQFKSSLIPYQTEDEYELSAGFGEGYTDCSSKKIVYWDKDIPYDRAVRIKGDSMEPEFHYGEVVLIKHQNYLDYPGQVCAVDDVERGLAYIKCVTVLEDGLLLESINDLEDDQGERVFPDRFIPFEDNPKIIGIVIDHFFPIPI